MKKAFTLVELLIVIAIIGVLCGALVPVISGGRDTALQKKCQVNLKNLATAALTYRDNNSNHSYPTAGSIVRVKTEKNGPVYREQPGWISWASENQFPRQSAGICSEISCYANEDLGRYAITNGAIWANMKGNFQGYCCPVHKEKHKHAIYSYQMNSFFGWSSDSDPYTYAEKFVTSASLDRANNTLLFAEIPFWGPRDGGGSNLGDRGEGETFGILKYDSSYAGSDRRSGSKSKEDGDDTIGFVHKRGKKWVANVVFAGGNTDEIVYDPKVTNLKELTYFLCEGIGWGVQGNKYVEIK